MSLDPAAREIPVHGAYEVKYSICALVTRPPEYREMVASFVNNGFTTRDCEFLYIDNSRGNQADAFAGYNLFLNTARGQYVILCHQDILLKPDNRQTLELRLAELDRIDPSWALAGNAGGIGPDQWAHRMTDDSGEQNTGRFPVKAQSLDENFILVKRAANLGLSHDLQGFHFHGTDLCQMAQILGWSAWVIDFNLYHKSGGRFDESFYEMSRRITEKYRCALKGGSVQTMAMRLHLSGSTVENWFHTPSRGRLAFEHQYQRRKQQKKGAPAGPALEFLDQPLDPVRAAFYWLAHKIRVPAENLFRAVAGKDRKSITSTDAETRP